MVARALLPANCPIDPGVNQTIGQHWAEQNVVNAQTGIPRPPVALIIPERIDLLRWMTGANRVYPALTEQSLERRASRGL
jgi:hypothetical protein